MNPTIVNINLIYPLTKGEPRTIEISFLEEVIARIFPSLWKKGEYDRELIGFEEYPYSPTEKDYLDVADSVIEEFERWLNGDTGF